MRAANSKAGRDAMLPDTKITSWSVVSLAEDANVHDTLSIAPIEKTEGCVETIAPFLWKICRGSGQVRV